MNWPTSSTRNTIRCCGPLESRYSLTHLQKFSTDIEKLSSAPSIHFSLRRLALAERFAERLDDLIPVELVGVPLLDPIEAGVLFVGGLERLQLALGFEVTLHVGDVRVVAAVALQLVQDLEEDPQDQVTSRAAAVVGLAVDVEEDDIGVRRRPPA